MGRLRTQSPWVAGVFGPLLVLCLLAPALGLAAYSSPGPRVTLDEGTVYGAPWKTTVHRARHGEPCFRAKAVDGDLQHVLKVCGQPTRHFLPDAQIPAGTDEEHGSLVLLATPRRARTVRMRLRDQPLLTVHPVLLDDERSEAAGLDQTFRYVSLPFEPEVCQRRVTALDRDDEVVFRSPRYPCPNKAALSR